MISLRFIACVILYGSLYGAVYVVNELIEGQSHSVLSWAAVFGRPFLAALAFAGGVILFVSWLGKTKW